jgi:uncharacterized protein YjbI with pentapeptide repeats
VEVFVAKEPDEKALREEWLERHVDQRFDKAHWDSIASMHWLTDEERANWSRENLRKALRERIEGQLKQPLSPLQANLLEELDGVSREAPILRNHTFHYDDPEQQRKAERQRDDLVREWNSTWRRRDDWFNPSLSGCQFDHKDVRGIDLRNAELAPKSGDHSRHEYANFSGAKFSGANISQSLFNDTLMDGVDLTRAYAVGSYFNRAILRKANLSGADLRDTNFENADLTDAKLVSADLRGAKLHGAILDGADLRAAQGVMVDENSVYRTKFNNRAGIVWRVFFIFARFIAWIGTKLRLASEAELVEMRKRQELEDSWSLLRRTYTGANLFISLLFLASFSVPYIAKAVLLNEIGHGEAAIVNKLDVAPPSTEASPRSTSDNKTSAADVLKQRTYPIWQILLGIDSGNYAWTMLICLLIVYNGLKWFLTTSIAPMRDAEERSHVTPALPEYRVFLSLHRVVSLLYWVSLATATYTAWTMITQPVIKFW